MDVKAADDTGTTMYQIMSHWKKLSPEEVVKYQHNFEAFMLDYFHVTSEAAVKYKNIVLTPVVVDTVEHLLEHCWGRDLFTFERINQLQRQRMAKVSRGKIYFLPAC